MGKYGTLGAIVLAVVGFIAYFTVAFTGDLQSNSIIEPANATMTVGEMRLTPHGGSGVDSDDSSPQGNKGMRAQDLIVEVTNDLLADKLDNTVYAIDWTFVDTEGNEITDASSIVNGAENPVVVEAEYTINRYDNSQIDDDGNIKDINSPMNSTTYRWGIYVDELARTGQPLGLGGNESDVEFRYYANNTYEDLHLDDYDLDGVSNIDALEDGSNAYGVFDEEVIQYLDKDNFEYPTAGVGG